VVNLAANALTLSLGPMDWLAVSLASLFAFLGRRLLRDVKRWLSPRS